MFMNTRRLGSLLVPLLLLVACSFKTEPDGKKDYVPVPGPGKVTHLTVKRPVLDDKMPASHQKQMIEAAEAWEVAVSDKCGLRFEPTVGPVDPNANPPENVITVRDGDTGGYYGWRAWNLPGAKIIMEPWLDDELYAIVARHELGHALTLGHEGTGIMANSTVITEDDADRACKKLDPNALAFTPSAGRSVWHCPAEAGDTALLVH